MKDESKKQDYSENCNFDDEDMNNDCFRCCYFCFPIGCMYHEVNSKEED